MSEIASAFVSIMPSMRGFGSKLQKDVGRETTSAGKAVGASFGKAFAAAGGALAAAGVGSFIKDAIGQASDLNESTTKIGAIFGKAAKDVQKFASKGAKALGQTKLEVLDAAATFGTFGKAAGLSGKDLAKFSTGFAGLSTDMASFFNSSPEEAVEAIGAALRGEAEPIRRFGVLLDDATLRNEALKLGLIKTTKDALTPQQKVLAAQAAIYKQTRDAQGDFARTSGGLANQQRILSAQWSDMKTKLGAGLLPAATSVVTALNDRFLPALEGAGGAVKDFFTSGAGASALATAMDGIRSAASKIGGAFTTASDKFSQLKADVEGMDAKGLGNLLGTAVAEGLNKIGSMGADLFSSISKLFAGIDWVGLGIEMGRQVPSLLVGLATGILNFDIGGLLAGIGDHWFEILMGIVTIAFAPAKFAGVLSKILTKIPFIGRFLAAAVTWLNTLGSKMLKFGGDLVRSFARGFGKIGIPGGKFIGNVLKALRGLPGKVFEFYKTLYTRIGVWALDAFEAAGRAARTATGKLISFVKTIPGKILRGFGKAGSLLVDVGKNIVTGLRDGIAGAWHFVTDKIEALINKIPKKVRELLGIHSPSRVMKAIGEFTVIGLADGIKKATTAQLQSALDAVKEKLQGARDAAKGVRDSVAGAFGGDLFSASNGASFLGNLTRQSALVRNLSKAFKTLLGWGLKPGFLSQLFQSGNSGLILSLASDKTLAKKSASQFAQVQRGLNGLGSQVARAEFGEAIRIDTRTIRQLAAEIARRTGQEINGAARNGKKGK